MKIGWPDSVVCTAATNGTLFGEPRPALPPLDLATEVGIVDLDPSGELARAPRASTITSMILCLSSQAVG